MHVRREIATLAASLVMLSACTNAPVQPQSEPTRETKPEIYPLKPCGDDPKQRDCSAAFFSDPKLIALRVPEAFPRRYLELWDPQVRKDECQDEACTKRLASLDAYFNPKGAPDSTKIGVALEGGGNKSAPFSLGVLAGLHQMNLWDRVGAIASVSGGTYAASFYFNRMLDLYWNQRELPLDVVTKARGTWFASCIPDAFASGGRHYFAAKPMAKQIAAYQCRELHNTPLAFDPAYQYQQQVWMHPDVLRLANDMPGDTDESLHADDIGNLLALVGMTAVTVPYQFVARTIFRWPVNSSPSRFAYRVGLEREYGYSPQDWDRALADDTPVWWHTLHVRRGERTLTTLAEKVGDHAPSWIILSTAPGYIDGFAWTKPAPRDPVRQQFEIMPNGFGSGTYGYARAHPPAPADFFGAHPNGLPIFDAVLASAAFFDDNEIRISKQPLRFLGGAGLQFANVDWYSEIRNFNVTDDDRTLYRSLTWPFYLHDTVKESETPYIHLQDGGNAENAGILPLLRRGYRAIVYAHGTTDAEAQFASICHLKNQLEYDGNYYIVSHDLQNLVGEKERAGKVPVPKGEFLNYLDQLCSEQIDASDLAAFDDNERRKEPQRVRAVAKVFCGRIGSYDTVEDVAYPKRAQPDIEYKPCAEYRHRFRWYGIDTNAEDGLPPTFRMRRALFYQSSVTPLRFHVCRGDVLQLAAIARAGGTPEVKTPVSTIIAVVPAVDSKDVKPQIDPNAGVGGEDWKVFCAASVEDRRKIAILACQAPDSTTVPQPPPPPAVTQLTLLPCAALAHVLEDTCKWTAEGDAVIPHPAFPQDGVDKLTLHIPYTTYAAYFDLGRAQVRRAIGVLRSRDQAGDDHASECAIPKAWPDGTRPHAQPSPSG